MKILTSFLLANTFCAAFAQTDVNDIRVFPSSNPQSEIHISISRFNPLNLIISANTYTTTYEQGYYISNNNGSTWTGADELQNSTSVGGDPSTAFNAIGDGYISSITGNGDGYFLQTSTNQGLIWSNLIRGVTASGFDKEMITVDDFPSSPYANYIYCAWTQFGSSTTVNFNRSIDGGQNFSQPITLQDGWGQGTNIQTNINGHVYVCWANYGTGSIPADGIGFTSSNNGGSSFTTAKVAFSYSGIRTSNSGDPNFNNIRVNDFPSMAVDKSGSLYQGRIYIAYSTKENGNGKSIIQVRHSTDEGNTWSSANTVSILAGRQNWFPWISVDPVTGSVCVIYYSFDSPSGFSTNTYVAYSYDGGVTFNNIRVSDVSHITAPINNSIFAAGYAGDYIGITSYNNIVYPSWMDNRNGTWQVYISPITLNNCIKAINNITFSSNTIDNACSGVTLTNVTINNNANVTFNTNGYGITINGTFNAQLGTTLEITP